MDGKIVSSQSIIGQQGANLIEKYVLKMRNVWRPIQIFDVGVDGDIEICDPVTGEATNTIIRVQAKATAQPFQAFVGVTAFEELCREWVLSQARVRHLPFLPEFVGSHWASDAQVDVVAINWRQKAILLGESKWGTDAVGRSVITELHEKASLVSPGSEWTIYYAFFARAGFTPAARDEAEKLNAILVDLDRLDQDLREAIEHP